jgi:predicted phosphodiesterase
MANFLLMGYVLTWTVSRGKMMGGLSWLHLSDWHQGNTEFDRTVVYKRLIEDIKNRTRTISQDLDEIDFIVFTGDVSYSGKQEEYERVRREFLDGVLEASGVEANKLYIIPGNHDVNIDDFRYLPSELREPLESEEKVQEWTDDDRGRYVVLQPFYFFNKFVQDYTEWEHSDYAPFDIFDKDGKRIAILGLNSAWMCNRHKTNDKIDDKNYVLIGEHQIRKSLNEIDKENVDLRIAILHHPFTWLKDFDCRRNEHLLTENCDFILTGHEHTPEAKMIQNENGFYMQISTGACFSQRIPNDPIFINAYNLVHLDIEKKSGKVYLRRWCDEQDRWIEDFQTSRNNGRKRFNLTIQVADDMLEESMKSAGINDVERGDH